MQFLKDDAHEEKKKWEEGGKKKRWGKEGKKKKIEGKKEKSIFTF